jgi:hypothetical protein
MDLLTAVGLVSVSTMIVAYALERRSHWYTLVFAAACIVAAAYAFLTDAWLFGILETIWYLVAMRRWVESQERS